LKILSLTLMNRLRSFSVKTFSRTSTRCSTIPSQKLSRFFLKESAWLLSNITAGTKAHVQAVIDAQLVPKVIELLSKGELPTRREAARCITNLSLSGKPEQVAYVLQQGVLEPFCNLLGSEDPQIVVVVLDGISNILKMASASDEDLDLITNHIEECGGLDKIETLQNDPNEEIYKLAFDVIDRYFSDKDQDEFPASYNAKKYDFNVSSDQPGAYNENKTASFDELTKNAASSDVAVQLIAVQAARKLLSSDKNPPINQIIEAGMLSILVECLEKDDNPKLQYEAACTLTQFASYSSERLQTQALFTTGAVSQFIRLSSSPHENVKEVVLCSLSNILVKGPWYFNELIKMGY